MAASPKAITGGCGGESKRAKVKGVSQRGMVRVAPEHRCQAKVGTGNFYRWSKRCHRRAAERGLGLCSEHGEVEMRGGVVERVLEAQRGLGEKR